MGRTFPYYMNIGYFGFILFLFISSSFFKNLHASFVLVFIVLLLVCHIGKESNRGHCTFYKVTSLIPLRCHVNYCVRSLSIIFFVVIDFTGFMIDD